MNEQLRLLIELQGLDTAIIEKAGIVEEIPRKLSKIEVPLRDSQAALDQRREALKQIEKKKKDREHALTEQQDRIKKLRQRTGDIKDNKAYQVHLKEIEAADKLAFAIEDEILACMQEAEDLGGELKAIEAAHAKVAAEVEAEKKKLEAEVAAARAELAALQAGRPAISSALPKDVYANYMRLLEGRGGLAVTEARSEICTGCNMTIMPQLFVELKKSQGFTSCPQCGRFIYYKETE